MGALQAVGQLISALVAVLGATGYVILLGAVVLWVRLKQADFPKEVPIANASREELLVMGGQALAVWVVLAGFMLVMGLWLLRSESVSHREVLAALALGVILSVAALAVIEEAWTLLLAALVALVGPGQVVIEALRLRPPVVHWFAGLFPAAVGAALPFLVSWLTDEVRPAGTALSAWVAFLGILACLPALLGLRREMIANGAAVTQLEMEREILAPQSAPANPLPPTRRLSTVNRLLASLRQNQRAARTRLWAGGGAVLAFALLLLGGVGVASQYEKKHLFRSALVSLNTGRCVAGTYVSRNKDHVVLGNQRRLNKQGDPVRRKGPNGKYPPENRVVLVPASEVLELQVRNPTVVGVRMRRVPCKRRAVIAPDGTQVEPFRGPKGAPGSTGPSGPRGESGAEGAQGDTGPAGESGATGDTGPKGNTGKQGPSRGATGPTGPRGVTGPRGPQGDTGPRGRRGESVVEGWG